MEDDIAAKAKAHIEKVFGGKDWASASKFFQTGLHVSHTSSTEVLELEQALYEKVQAQYPYLHITRNIRVRGTRSYSIEMGCDRTKAGPETFYSGSRGIDIGTVELTEKQKEILSFFNEYAHEHLTRLTVANRFGSVELIEDDLKALDDMFLLHIKIMVVTTKSRLSSDESKESFMSGTITGNGIKYIKSLKQ